MKIQHDNESYSIVLDDGSESEIEYFGVPVMASQGANEYFAFMLSPTKAHPDLQPVVYKIEAQSTVMEEVEFADDDEEDDPEDDPEDENNGVERSAPRQL